MLPTASASWRVPVRVPHNDLERPRSLAHQRDDFAVEGNIHQLPQGGGGYAEPGHRAAVSPDLQLGHVSLLLDRDVDEAGDAVRDRFNLCRQLAQPLQVDAEQVDGNRGPRARQHVVNPVPDRLADRDVGTREASQIRPDLGHHLRQLAIGEVQPGINLGCVRSLRVLVQLRPPGAARC